MSSQSSQDTSTTQESERIHNRTLRPKSTTFREFMTSGWDDEQPNVSRLESSAYITSRLEALGKQFAGERLVIPAGSLKVRSNDCDYQFRPNTTFAYYTGLGCDYEPGAVLVLDPIGKDQQTNTYDHTGDEVTIPTHRVELFVAPRADQHTQAYYTSARHGEYWIGPRAGLVELSAMTGIPTRDIAQLPEALAVNSDTVKLRILHETDPEITAIVDNLRQQSGVSQELMRKDDEKLHEFAAEARLLKDEYEIRQMKEAIDATFEGFNRLLERLPQAVNKDRSERMLEGAFNSVSRERGNTVGYESIVASGAHAPILHWIRNTGTVASGDLLLVDAGVEVDSLYTADITRTFPVNGTFSPLQRDIYQTVLDAQLAGFEAAQVGATYSDIHHACMEVLARKLYEWGILPVSVEESLDPEGQHHRRWHACGCAHHLGLDVHDCNQARYECYQGARLTPGMIFTIEPGLYFKENDLLIPPEFRGIGVRIEDDVLMGEDGPIWLSGAIPKTIDDVEAWMKRCAASHA